MKHFLLHLRESMDRFWDAPSISDYNGDTYTFSGLAGKMAMLHIVFERMGIADTDKVAICAKNSANWAIAFMATVSYGAVAVPLLADFNPESVNRLVAHSEASILFTDPERWVKYDICKMPAVKCVISTKDFSPLYVSDRRTQAVFADSEKDFSEKYPSGVGKDSLKFAASDLDKLTIINYTSGTTSEPKGVMLTARSLTSNIEFGMRRIPVSVGNNVLSMLPMAHMYGLAFEFMYPLCSGCHIYFLGSTPAPRVLLQAFAKVRPYMMITVPLVMEKIFAKSVLPALDKPAVRFLRRLPGFRGMILSKARRSLLSAFGGRIRHIIIGGAAINPDVERWMKKLRLPYTVGYGMTECGPLIGYEDWHAFKMQSCGKIVDRMEIRVDSEDPCNVAGELQVKGDNVMLGYYKNAEATAASFTDDGWMRTGDLGVVDKDGNIFIRGRSKNMILGANGQNIYPEEIESLLNSQPYIVESVVVERDKKIVAIVFPDMDRISQEQLDELGINKMLEQTRVNMNLLLPGYSKIAKIEMLMQGFEKTPKMSIKRFLYK